MEYHGDEKVRYFVCDKCHRDYEVFDPGICRAITTRTPSVSWKNLFPGQIYPITAVMIEYD